MTSIPPAEPRPPPLRPPASLLLPPARVTSNGLPHLDRRPQIVQNVLAEPLDDRPVKRRKVDDDGGLKAGTSSVPAAPGFAEPAQKQQGLRLVNTSTLIAAYRGRDGKNDEPGSVVADVPELPGRPWTLARQGKPAEDTKPTHRSRPNISVPTVPESLEEPSTAPLLGPARPAGFAPWTGNHPEDNLSELNVKQGYAERPTPDLVRESGTARVSLYNGLKNKMGVNHLSTIFGALLERKAQHNAIISAPNWKPPPRITLTEAKRKSWIADLANADVPLRKLSRTIPQGIRGQLLLDQCLQNFVPLNRAIWFAKCVCANEIRTLRKKGTTPAVLLATEGKWLREWTINVEQFIEARLAQGPLADWKTTIQYALRLTTRLYMESLLDRDHYLDWIVRSLSNGGLNQTPFWLMVTHIYKQDLSQYRQRSRKLAEALAIKFSDLSRATNQPQLLLRQKLQEAVHGLLVSRPACFLVPDKWPELVGVVQSCLRTDVPRERQILCHLNSVNERSMGVNKQKYVNKRAPDQVVVDILDTLRAPYNTPSLMERLSAACPDVNALMHVCLEWATTRFRSSKTRIYLVSRLLRRWQRTGHDTNSAILKFMSTYSERASGSDLESLKHLVAQLARSESFPTSKYFQWLMVRGLPVPGTLHNLTLSGQGMMMGARDHERPNSSEHPHLLFDIPLQATPDHVLNLRKSILDRAGFDSEEQSALLRQCIETIKRAIAQRNGADGAQHGDPVGSTIDFSKLPWTIRSEVALWLRALVVDRCASMRTAINIGPKFESPKILNCSQYLFIRYILECMEDEAVLADIVGILGSMRDEELLASLVDTVHQHADTFSAIGAFEILQHRLCQMYMNLRALNTNMPIFATALIELCTAHPVKVPAIKLFQQDFVRGDRGRAIAACSPYSDGIAESLQRAEATFTEDFEAILQSEPNMNAHTMNGLFAVLVDRIGKLQHSRDTQSVYSYCLLLARLKLCRRVQADGLIKEWIGKLASSLDADFGCLLFSSLVGTTCISLAALVEATHSPKQDQGVSAGLKTMLQAVLQSKLWKPSDIMLYRTRTKWHEYVQQEPAGALDLLCQSGFESALQSSARPLLSALVSENPPVSTLHPRAAAAFFKGVVSLLRCRETRANPSALRDLLESVDKFSHQFVRLYFQFSPHSWPDETQQPDNNEDSLAMAKTVDEILQRAETSGDSDLRFSRSLEAVGPEVANHLRHKVEAEFLEALPKYSVSRVAASPLTAAFPADTQELSLIVEKGFRVCTEATTPSAGFVSQLIEKLTQFYKCLGVASGNPSASATSAIPAVPSAASPRAGQAESATNLLPTTMLDHLRLMLQMVCLQRHALFPPTKGLANSKLAQQEQIHILVRLALIATHPVFSSVSNTFSAKEDQAKAREVIDFALDVVATVVDEVTDEIKLICAKMLRDKLHDARLRYLFGSINTLGSTQVQDLGQGLLLLKEGKGVVGEWKPQYFEVLDNASGKELDTSLRLGLFGARRG